MAHSHSAFNYGSSLPLTDVERAQQTQMIMKLFEYWGLTYKQQAIALGLSPNTETSIHRYKSGKQFLPLFRSVNTDLNVTLALAAIAVIAVEVSGIIAVGFLRYGKKFFNFSSPINFTVGIIEFVSELSRFISFSFRLFGNVFAGEVLIAVIAFFVPYFLPVPVMAFELFVGFVQAAVFPLLTLFFLKLAIIDPHEHQ